MENQPELHIDRSFDQTAEHVHRNGEPCPTCKSFECIGATPAGDKDADAEKPFCRYCVYCGSSIPKGRIRIDEFCSQVCRSTANNIAGINAAGPDDFGGEDFPTDRQPRATGNTFPEHLRRPFDRHVSPAILEQRILDLEAERDLLETAYKRELSRRKEAETRVRYIEKRIKHFEGLVSVLSRYIDKLAVTAAQVQRTAKFATDFAGQLKGGQPLPFAFPAEETDETRKRA